MTDLAYITHCYLRQIRNLSTETAVNKLEQEDLFNKAQGCGGMSAGLKVQTSPRGDAMELAVAKLVELEDKYKVLFEEYVRRRDEVLEAINDLNHDAQTVIKLYYVYNEKDADIAKRIHLTRSRVTQIRHETLDKLGGKGAFPMAEALHDEKIS